MVRTKVRLELLTLRLLSFFCSALAVSCLALLGVGIQYGFETKLCGFSICNNGVALCVFRLSIFAVANTASAFAFNSLRRMVISLKEGL